MKGALLGVTIVICPGVFHVIHAIRCMAASGGKRMAYDSFKCLQKSLDLRSFKQGRPRLAFVLGRLGWMPYAPTLAGCVNFIVHCVHVVFRLHPWLPFMWLHDRGRLNKHVYSLCLGAHRKQIRVDPFAFYARSCVWLMWSAESVFLLRSNMGKMQCCLFLSYYFVKEKKMLLYFVLQCALSQCTEVIAFWCACFPCLHWKELKRKYSMLEFQLL